MDPRQHPDDPTTHQCRCERKCGCAEHAKDGGVLPTIGFPRADGMANEEERAKTNGHGANTSISYMQGHLIAVVSGYTFEACVSGGSSS